MATITERKRVDRRRRSQGHNCPHLGQDAGPVHPDDRHRNILLRPNLYRWHSEAERDPAPRPQLTSAEDAQPLLCGGRECEHARAVGQIFGNAPHTCLSRYLCCIILVEWKKKRGFRLRFFPLWYVSLLNYFYWKYFWTGKPSYSKTSLAKMQRTLRALKQIHHCNQRLKSDIKNRLNRMLFVGFDNHWLEVKNVFVIIFQTKV